MADLSDLGAIRRPSSPQPVSGGAVFRRDQALFAEFEANLASLSAEAQTTIEPYLLPPNDPASAWGVQPATVTRPGFGRRPSSADDPLPFPPDLKWRRPGGAPHGLDTHREAQRTMASWHGWGCAAPKEELEGVPL